MLALATPSPGATELLPAAPPAWHLALSVATATPAALPEGLGIGVLGDVQRRLGGASFASARLGWTAATGANPINRFDHHQFLAAASAGVFAKRGVGRVWLQVGGGAQAIYEIIARQEGRRLGAPRPLGSTHFVLGPYAFGEIGITLALRGAWRGVLALGPTVLRTVVNDQPRWRGGGLVRLGGGYGF